MNIKGPVGKCRYCGQEFMTKGGLKVHEAEKCPQKPPQETEEQQDRWRQVVQGNGMAVWVRQ